MAEENKWKRDQEEEEEEEEEEVDEAVSAFESQIL